MKVLLIAVVSINGKITHRNDYDIYKWTSVEDQMFFFDLRDSSNLIVMGSGTYEAVRDKIKHSAMRLRIVLTSNTEKYKGQEIDGQLEFSSETPMELVKRLSKEYDQMLLAGGSEIYSSFIKENLVDEIYLTVEPVVFGSGKNLFSESELESKLKLESIEKLNDHGTLLLKYKVIK